MSGTTGKTRSKAFKVVAVSSNMNAFGLTGMVLVARDGEAWQVGANHINVKKQGSVLRVPGKATVRNFAALGFEIPERLPVAPPLVVAAVWVEKP